MRCVLMKNKPFAFKNGFGTSTIKSDCLSQSILKWNASCTVESVMAIQECNYRMDFSIFPTEIYLVSDWENRGSGTG